MKTSQRGLDDIILSEGEKLVAYRDRLTKPGGVYLDVWTIGVGHTSAAGPPIVTEGMRITHELSREILSRDIAAVENRVSTALHGRVVPQSVFDGAVSFDFNTGGITHASWVGYWLSGDMVNAEAHFLQWNKPPEIIGRRKREADLIFRGRYATGASAPLTPAPKPSPPAAPPAPVPHTVAVGSAVGVGGLAAGLLGNDPTQAVLIGVGVALAFALVIYVLRRR